MRRINDGPTELSDLQWPPLTIDLLAIFNELSRLQLQNPTYFRMDHVNLPLKQYEYFCISFIRQYIRRRLLSDKRGYADAKIIEVRLAKLEKFRSSTKGKQDVPDLNRRSINLQVPPTVASTRMSTAVQRQQRDSFNSERVIHHFFSLVRLSVHPFIAAVALQSIARKTTENNNEACCYRCTAQSIR